MGLILFFDTETTGIPIWKEPSDDERQPHLVSVAAQLVDEDTQEVKGELDAIVRPEGWEWDETDDAFKLHGITMEKAMDVGLTEDKVIDMFMQLHSTCALRVAHNTTFDNRMIRIGLARYYDKELADKFKSDPYYCTLVNCRKEMGGKSGHKLGECYQHFLGKELVGAHNAMVDTEACREIYFALQSSE
jgi:DNA polymerase-3 subunit epsilon